MENLAKKKDSSFLEKAAINATVVAGKTTTFVFAFSLVMLWLALGFTYDFSEHWFLIFTTVPTVITFLMVFLLQKSQNKDSLAIQLKLNELVAAHEAASNRLVSVENMTEDELNVLKKYYGKLSDFAAKEQSMQQSHSIDEIHAEHDIKNEMQQELNKKSIDPEK